MKTIPQLKNKIIKSIQIERTTQRGQSFLLMKFTDGDFFYIATKKDFNLYSDDVAIKMKHTTTIDCDYSDSVSLTGSTIESVEISSLDKNTPIGKRKSIYNVTFFTNKGTTNYTIESARIPEITDYEPQFFLNGNLSKNLITPEELIEA